MTALEDATCLHPHLSVTGFIYDRRM